MRNIAIDIRPLLEQEWGGVSWYTYYLVDKLVLEAEQGALRLVLFYNQHSSLFHCFIVSLLKRWTKCQNVFIKGYKLPNKILNLSMQFIKYPYIDELLTMEPALAKGFGGQAIDGFILPNLSCISMSCQTKRIAVCHDLSFEIFPEFFTLRQRLWHKMIQPRIFYQKADKVIAVSQNTKQDLIDLYGISADKVTVIYPGVNHHRFKIIEDCGAVQKKYNLPNDFILFVGVLEPRKNLETVIEAYDLLCKSVDVLTRIPALIIAGPEGWKFDRIYRFWLKAKHKSRIRFINKVNSTDLPVLYNLASIFIYPSFYEGFGFPPAEAMACGTPVISGHGSSLPEIIGNAGLLIDPFNIADMARAMADLLRDQRLYDKLRKRGLERAREFRWEKTVKQVLSLL